MKNNHRNDSFFKYGLITLFIFLLLINFFYVISGVVFFPLRSMDAIGIWLFKAKAFYLDNGFLSQILYSPDYLYSHQQYPMLLPFLFFLVYKISGTINEINILLFYPFLYLVILFLVYRTLRSKTCTFFSLLYTYLYSMFSPLLSSAGRVHAGNADIVLCLINWLVVFILYRKKTENIQQRNLWLLVLLAMISSQIKTEGVFLSMIFLLLPLNLTKKLFFFTLSFLPFLFWQVIVWWFKIPRDLSFTLLSFGDLTNKLSIILADIFTELSNLRNWYIFWPIFLGSLFLPGKLPKLTKSIFVRHLVIVSLLFLFVFLFYSLGAEGRVSGLVDRVLLQLSPFFFLIFFEKTYPLLSNSFIRSKIHLNQKSN